MTTNITYLSMAGLVHTVGRAIDLAPASRATFDVPAGRPIRRPVLMPQGESTHFPIRQDEDPEWAPEFAHGNDIY